MERLIAGVDVPIKLVANLNRFSALFLYLDKLFLGKVNERQCALIFLLFRWTKPVL